MREDGARLPQRDIGQQGQRSGSVHLMPSPLSLRGVWWGSHDMLARSKSEGKAAAPANAAVGVDLDAKGLDVVGAVGAAREV